MLERQEKRILESGLVINFMPETEFLLQTFIPDGARRSVDIPRGLPWGTDRRGIQGGMPPWSQGAGSYPAREGEAGSSDEVRATVKASFAGRYAKRLLL